MCVACSANATQVEAVSDGQAALEAAWQRRPDLVLSDVMMPRLDGFGLLQALRNDSQSPRRAGHPAVCPCWRGGETSKGWRRAPTTISSSRSARASCWRGYAPISIWRRCDAMLCASRTNCAARRRWRRERAEPSSRSINDGFLVLDRRLALHLCQCGGGAHAWPRRCGADRQEIIGTNIPRPLVRPWRPTYRRAMTERVTCRLRDYYEPWKRWFDLRVYPAGDGGLSIYFQDMTERKISEEALAPPQRNAGAPGFERTAELQAKEARLRTIFETSYAYQGLMALDGTLLDANATSLSGIGARLEDVVGRPFWETPWFTGHPGMTEMVRAAISAVAGGEMVRQEIHVNLPVGGWRWFDFQMRPVRDQRVRLSQSSRKQSNLRSDEPQRKQCGRRKRWKPSVSLPAESPMTSTTCSPSFDHQPIFSGDAIFHRSGGGDI